MMKLEQFKNCVSIDLETTGIDPEINGMISAGVCTIFDNKLYLENALRDGVEITDIALEVNGADREELLTRNERLFPSEADCLLSIFIFCNTFNNWVIIGKNPKFDYSFLLKIWERNREYFREKGFEKFPFTYRVVDYSSLALPLFLLDGYDIPHTGVSSSEIQKLLMIPEEPKPHNALTGAEYNILALKKLISLYKGKYDQIYSTLGDCL